MSNANKLMQAASSVSTGGAQAIDTIFVGAFNIFTTIDVTDASNMAVLDSLTGPSNTISLTTYRNTAGPANGHAFMVGGSTDKFVSIDVSDTSNLSISETFTDATDLDGAKACAVDDALDLAFIGSSSDSKILTMDISDPANMSKTSVLSSIVHDENLVIDTERSYLFGISTSGGLASLSYNSSGVLTSQDTISLVSTGGRGLDINTSTQHVYSVGWTNDAIQSVDYSDITNLSIADTLTDAVNLTEPVAVGVDATNNKAVVVCTDPGALVVIDISDPTNLSVNGRFATSVLTGNPYAGIICDEVNQIAYVSIYNNNIHAFDYSGSGAPNILDTLGLTGLSDYATSIIAV